MSFSKIAYRKKHALRILAVMLEFCDSEGWITTKKISELLLFNVHGTRYYLQKMEEMFFIDCRLEKYEYYDKAGEPTRGGRYWWRLSEIGKNMIGLIGIAGVVDFVWGTTDYGGC